MLVRFGIDFILGQIKLDFLGLVPTAKLASHLIESH